MIRHALVPLACLALLGSAPLAAAGEGHAAKPSYLPLRTEVVTVIRPNGRRGAMTVDVGVDAPDPALRDRVEQSVPLLRDGYQRILQAYATGLPAGVAPNADYLSYALQRETDRVLGRKGARFLIGTILVN